jgi:hypothetical protein
VSSVPSKNKKVRRAGRKSKPRSGRPEGKVPKAVVNRTYDFVRTATSNSLTLVTVNASAGGSTTLSSGGLLSLATGAVQQQYYFGVSAGFCLADVPSATDFTNLFERWRINAIEVSLWPMNTSSIASVSGGNGDLGVLLHSVIDYNDRAAVTASDAGINPLRQRPTYRMHQCAARGPIVFKFRPRMAIAGYGSTFFANYVSLAPQWCDAASPTTEHYGLKLIFEVMNPTAANSFVNFKMEVKYWLSMTDVY